MTSQYLDFVPNMGRDKSFDEDDIFVYTKKTKKRILVGYIRQKVALLMFGERKFIPMDNVFFGKHCLLALSRYMSELDKKRDLYD